MITRDVVGAYVTAVRHIGARVLELLSEGLGLEKEYLAGSLSKDDFLIGNYYPPCPDPSLTLGLSEHTDPSLITILFPGPTPGLQMRKDGQWFDIETLPNAFVVIVGNQLEVVSNGKLKSGVHRAVTNSSEARISIAFFINPTQECIVQPAKTDDGDNPPLFRAFQYKTFFTTFMRKNGDRDGDRDERVLEPFKINY
ncbi:2'-deoxymugineic-acid 2'-dioxygenase-like [Silene latifolia]|uniref:2'-deoxymugineic-acid 2'-dioxygenase-like n=1 Tax=Silene latifolia TaxID=37657 RepID=UPI003D7721DC